MTKMCLQASILLHTGAEKLGKVHIQLLADDSAKSAEPHCNRYGLDGGWRLIT